MTPGRRKPGDGPSKTQRYALLAAKSGKLFDTRDGLRLHHDGHKTLPVRTFGPAVVKACIKAGWAMKMDQGDGRFRVMTTLAGDAALAVPMRFVQRSAVGDWKREALR